MQSTHQDKKIRNRLDAIENKIRTYYQVKITDKEFLQQPLTRQSELARLLESNNRKKEVILLELNESKQEFSLLTQQLTAKNADLSSKGISTLENKAIDLSNKMEALANEIELLESSNAAISKSLDQMMSGDYHDYKLIYLEKIKLKSQLKIDQENELTEIKAFRKSTSQSSFDLLETIAKHIKESPQWYDNFEKRHDFKLVANDMNGVMPIKFVSKNGSTIEVDNDVISASPKLTTETMKQVGPALLAILIKCIETTHMPGCVITDGSQEVIQYMEKLYAEALKNKHPNFTINGKSIDTILSANPKINQIDNSASADKENLVNVDRLNNHHK